MNFQKRVREWAVACFGKEQADDRILRSHRFLEEALELAQAVGCTKDEANQLVNYVYGRPTGEVKQEVGGVMITLFALCAAHEVECELCGIEELSRVWSLIDKIRQKNANKPKFSPLPE